MPIIHHRLAGVWRLFHLTHFADVWNPMTGRLEGRDMRQVEVIARAIDEPFDARGIDQLTTILDAYIKDVRKRMKK
jgi:hypothetical protein